MTNRVASWLAVAVAVACPGSRAVGDPPGWNREAAGKYLDARCKEWLEFAGAGRGQGATRTSCVSCHTLLSYALGRPALRTTAGAATPTEAEQALLARTTKRVEAWASLDTPPYGLLYDFSDPKKRESWGTEAVLNALILASDDRRQGRGGPTAVTRKAFANLWAAQAAEGPQRGSWEWLDFGLEPWESKGGRYYGAALATVAVGTAPGYYTPGADPATDARVELLRAYLKGGFAAQNLHNRVWALRASAALDGVLNPGERQGVIDQVLALQRADGGWGLPALGDFKRKDGTPQAADSDGYATGLVVHALLTAGVGKNHPAVAKGLAWLRANQAPTGEWRCASVNKKRDPATHAGKFMSDAATAFAVLALSHE
jgi:hypothetical protein